MTVTNVRFQGCTHYIGRPRRGDPPNPLANTYSHQRSAHPETVLVATRREAIERWEFDARNSVAILEAIEALPADAVLGCWCAPAPCHGEVIVKIWKELHDGLATEEVTG